MRILVTGSRDLTDRTLVAMAIQDAIGPGDDTVVVGDCPTGADSFARDYWPRLDVHTADWEKHGKPAGPLRNQAMVDSGADICLAFYRDGAGNRGTADCVRRARAAGIPVFEYTEANPA